MIASAKGWNTKFSQSKLNQKVCTMKNFKPATTQTFFVLLSLVAFVALKNSSLDITILSSILG